MATMTGLLMLLSPMIPLTSLFVHCRYKPPPVWGTSGHIQTAVYSMMEKRPGLDLSGLCSNRYSVRLQDGSTVFYDVFGASDQKDISGTSVGRFQIVNIRHQFFFVSPILIIYCSLYSANLSPHHA